MDKAHVLSVLPVTPVSQRRWSRVPPSNGRLAVAKEMDFATSTLLACTQPTMTIPFQVTNAMQVPTLNMVMETLSSRLTPKLARIALQVTTVPHPTWHHKCAHQVNTDQTLAEIQLASQSATGTTRSLQRLIVNRLYWVKSIHLKSNRYKLLKKY